MNKLQERIKDLEKWFVLNGDSIPLMNENYAKGQLKGIRFAQEEILKMIKDLENNHNGAWVLNELKKQIKGDDKG